MVEVARRAADHVCDAFGPTATRASAATRRSRWRSSSCTGPPGRSATSSRRGCSSSGAAGPRWPTSSAAAPTSRTTCRSATRDAFRGHAVRALYLASGAVDVAVETGDDELLAAIERQWERTIARAHLPDRRHGLAAQRRGVRRGLRAAARPRVLGDVRRRRVGACSRWRLLLATGDARYADLAERTLYNVVATSPALDGRGVLLRQPAAPAGAGRGARRRTPRARARPRACARRGSTSPAARPTSAARSRASPATWRPPTTAACRSTSSLARATIRTAGRGAARRDRTTRGRGEVVVRVERDRRRPVAARACACPRWAGEAVLVDRGRRRPVRPGYADRRRRAGGRATRSGSSCPWRRAGRVPDPRVDAVRGCVAAERGPLVYCLESTDQEADVSLADVSRRRTRNACTDAGDAPRRRWSPTRSERSPERRRRSRSSRTTRGATAGWPRCASGFPRADAYGATRWPSRRSRYQR